MKRVKKLTAIALSLAMLATSMAGCGSSAPSSVAPAPSNSSAASEPAKEIVLNFPCIWVAKDSKAEVFGQMVNAFNEENKGKIKVVIEEQTDYQAYRDKLRTLISTGNAPDIFTVDSADDAANFAKSGKLLELTPYMTDEWKGKFNAGIIDDAMIDGKLYVLPYESAYWPVMYNKRLLADVGYDQFPKTYDELWDCCEKLKAKGITPMSQMTGENAYTTIQWLSYAAAAAGGKDAAVNLDDPAMVTAAEIVQKMYTYTTSDAIGAGAAISAGHFLNERTAIFMNGPWFFGRLKKEGVAGLYENVGLAYAPTLAGGKGQEKVMTGMIQNRLALGNQTDPAKAEAAVKFLQFVSQPEWVSKLSLSSGALFTVNTGALEGMDRLQSELIEMVNQAPYIAITVQMLPLPVQTELPQALDALVMGEFTPQEFVDTLKAVN